jgi:hypothetical protein
MGADQTVIRTSASGLGGNVDGSGAKHEIRIWVPIAIRTSERDHQRERPLRQRI